MSPIHLISLATWTLLLVPFFAVIGDFANVCDDSHEPKERALYLIKSISWLAATLVGAAGAAYIWSLG